MKQFLDYFNGICLPVYGVSSLSVTVGDSLDLQDFAGSSTFSLFLLSGHTFAVFANTLLLPSDVSFVLRTLVAK